MPKQRNGTLVFGMMIIPQQGCFYFANFPDHFSGLKP